GPGGPRPIPPRPGPPTTTMGPGSTFPMPMGSMDPSSPSGFGTGQLSVSESQLTSGLIELDVYGVVSLYEKYLTPEEKAAAEEKAAKEKEAKDKEKEAKEAKDKEPKDADAKDTDADDKKPADKEKEPTG